jgi:hypothetical protein
VSSMSTDDVCGAEGFELCLVSSNNDNGAEAREGGELGGEAAAVTSAPNNQDCRVFESGGVGIGGPWCREGEVLGGEEAYYTCRRMQSVQSNTDVDGTVIYIPAMMFVGKVAHSSSETPSGTSAVKSSSSTAYCCRPTKAAWLKTLSPTLNLVTPSPRTVTTPTTSFARLLGKLSLMKRPQSRAFWS